MLLACVVSRQRLDDEIEPQPQAPTVMIKSHWKHNGHHKEQCKHILVFCADNQQKEEANQQDYELCRDHICQDGAYEKPILTLEEREAVWAVMSYVKRGCGDPGFATRGTPQFQATSQHFFDLSKVFFQGNTHINAG